MREASVLYSFGVFFPVLARILPLPSCATIFLYYILDFFAVGKGISAGILTDLCTLALKGLSL